MPDLHRVLVDQNQKYKNLHKEYNLFLKRKQDIQDIFTKLNQTNPVLDMIWFMEILRIYLEEKLLIKYYIAKHYIAKNQKYDEHQYGLV